MKTNDGLRRALLELGLEDLIPLPQIEEVSEVRTAVENGTGDGYASVLVDLLREGRIQLWRGHWTQDPEPVDKRTAEKLLRDAENFKYDTPAELVSRVYYANVEDIRHP